MKKPLLIVTTLAMALSMGFAFGAEQEREQIYGSQLMTEQERTEHRAKMRAAKTAEEREQIRAEHHERMQERAKAQGVTLPDDPPARGGGIGPGGGDMGPGGGGGADIQQMRPEHQMEHATHRNRLSSTTPLTESGESAFGAIQEVIEKLNSDPRVDWKKVNLEALRQHLADMHHFTINVEVLSQTPIDNGVKVALRPTVPQAEASLDRVFSVHPQQLQHEMGWEMKVTKQGGAYVLTITSKNPSDVDKIRGLGYIGVMAVGQHHLLHHWLMATGINPHH